MPKLPLILHCDFLLGEKTVKITNDGRSDKGGKALATFIPLALEQLTFVPLYLPALNICTSDQILDI